MALSIITQNIVEHSWHSDFQYKALSIATIHILTLCMMILRIKELKTRTNVLLNAAI